MDNTNETNNTELTITTINVNDLNSSQKRNKIFNWLKSQKIVITLIQETHSTHSVQQLSGEKNGTECLFGTLAHRTSQLV